MFSQQNLEWGVRIINRDLILWNFRIFSELVSLLELKCWQLLVAMYIWNWRCRDSLYYNRNLSDGNSCGLSKSVLALFNML